MMDDETGGGEVASMKGGPHALAMWDGGKDHWHSAVPALRSDHM